MLITLLSYFDTGETTSDDYSDISPTRSIVSDSMSHTDEEWEQIRIPIPLSVEEDYEIVIPPSIVPSSMDAHDSSPRTARSGGIMLQRLREWRHQQSLQRNQLGLSISKTFAELSREDPDQMEKDAIKRAMELSMLDMALVQYHPNNNHSPQDQQSSPHVVLGVSRNANPAEIKAAYRKLARLHHPDKGGKAHRFEEIARAYRSMLSSTSFSSTETKDERIASIGYYYGHNQEQRSQKIQLTTASCDKELQDHKRLVNDLFQADGMDLQACVEKQLTALGMLGLAFKDAGAINRNERNEIIHNSCFYLSLATSYLWGIGALSFHNSEEENTKEEDELLIGDTALQLKRTIEAAVVKAHPEWVLEGKVGEEVQAFSDFLVYTLDSQTQLSELAVVIFDATSGFCDVYKGKNYEDRTPSLQSNTITLRYIPGHYQPLIPSNSYAYRPALRDIKNVLDDLGVFYVITDGNS